MAKIINACNQEFIHINANIARSNKLGIKERGLLLTLLSLPTGWNYSIAGLAEILPDGKATIESTMKKLEELGYVVRTKQKSLNGHFAGYDYVIYDEPMADKEEQHAENPMTEIPFTENPSTEKPLTENRQQLKIESSFIESNTLKDKEYTKILDSIVSEKPLTVNKCRYIEYEGMKLTQKQYDDIARLVEDANNGIIDAFKMNIINYVKKLYDELTMTFRKQNGEVIYSLYGYVKSNFTIKTQNDQRNNQLVMSC